MKTNLMKKKKRMPATAMKRIRQRATAIVKSDVNWIGIIANICTIITFGGLVISIIYGYNTLKDYSYNRKFREDSKAAVDEWKKELDALRIGNNYRYIESIIGFPTISYDVDFKGYKFEKSEYVNEYFSLICFYNNSSLYGFLIIGNNEKFNFKNYRCNFSLFDYTINEAEKYCLKNNTGSVLLLRNNCSGRLDNNDYYFECNLQRSQSAGGLYVIGYGVTDIGYIRERERFDSCFRAMNRIDFSGPDSVPQITDIDNGNYNDQIRQAPINAFLVFDDNNHSLAIDIISECIVMPSSLGMTKEAYANQQKNYKTSIASFNSNG